MFIENLLSTWDGTLAEDPEINTTRKAPALVGVYSSRASGTKASESWVHKYFWSVMGAEK